MTATPGHAPDAAELVIFPYNGNGIEALDCLGQAWRLVAFIDDTPAKHGPGIGGSTVTGRAALRVWPQARVLAVPGSPLSYRSRAGLIRELDVEAGRFATVVHPRAAVSALARIGHNVLLMAGVVVTSNAVIGDHVCVLPNTVIHHDAHIGSWSLVGSNVTIAGHAVLGENCYIGSGTSVMNGVRIGDGALVGLGSTVTRDVPPGARVVGNPARLLT